AAYLRMRSASPPPQRYSTRTLSPSVQPNCCSGLQECRKTWLQDRIVRDARERADAADALGLLGARDQWPTGRRAANELNELAPPHGPPRLRTGHRTNTHE